MCLREHLLGIKFGRFMSFMNLDVQISPQIWGIRNHYFLNKLYAPFYTLFSLWTPIMHIPLSGISLSSHRLSSLFILCFPVDNFKWPIFYFTDSFFCLIKPIVEAPCSSFSLYTLYCSVPRRGLSCTPLSQQEETKPATSGSSHWLLQAPALGAWARWPWEPELQQAHLLRISTRVFHKVPWKLFVPKGIQSKRLGTIGVWDFRQKPHLLFSLSARFLSKSVNCDSSRACVDVRLFVLVSWPWWGGGVQEEGSSPHSVPPYSTGGTALVLEACT